MKKIAAAALICLLMFVGSIAVATEDCPHTHTEHISYYMNVTNVGDGHELRTYEKVYCNDCETSVTILRSVFL